MATDIKHTQLTRVGYTYQDYICIQKLVEWYRDPQKYQWISIEGAESEDGKFKGLDDVVAFDQEGFYELYQVKFTTDPDDEKNTLSFDWLTQHKPKGTSLLQKWAADVERYGQLGKLSIASLKTNRKPDEVVAGCLEGRKLNIEKVSAQVLTEIDAQLGGREKTEAFFKAFNFEHSLKKIDTLEQDLESQLVPDHASSEGWLRLLKTVQYWATRKNQPEPDGRITLGHLTEIISRKSQSTLSQFFEIPDGYAPSSENFHSEILENTLRPGCVVISGLPGTGKSTYLSFLTDELSSSDRAVIRHHYSIDSHGLSDRISFTNAAQSLLAQLREVVPKANVSENVGSDELEKKIADAAEALSAEGKTCLTIIVDGLDHVARERSDISQLEHMLNRLLELKNQVCVILGTQPVSDEQLPSKLTAAAPREEWKTLPYMDLNSIKSWLVAQIERDEVRLRGGKDNRDRELSEVSQSLLKISGGYPLHLIYSIKTLTAQDKVVSSYEIDSLPICSDGDIRTYYNVLWSNLSPSARETLVLVSSVHFQWPNIESLRFCVEQTDFYKTFDEIRHLVEIRRSGIFVFHSSIIVFVREQEVYEQNKLDVMKKVSVWLEERAPDFWKWGWAWVAQAELGNPAPLFNGISYDWSVDALRRGYPLDHIEHVISFAEEVAFERREFKTLTKLRHIRHRVVSGPEFQLQNYSEFLECALKVHPNNYCLYWRVDNLRTLSDGEISVIASLSKDVDQRIIDDIYNEVIRRLNFYARLKDHDSNERVGSLISAAITVLASSQSPNLDLFYELLGRLKDKTHYFQIFLNELHRLGNDFVILSMQEGDVPKGAENSYWDNFFRACYLEGVPFFERVSEQSGFSSPLVEFARLIKGEASPGAKFPAPHIGEADFVSESYFRDFFFHCLFDSENEERAEGPLGEPQISLKDVNDAELVIRILANEYKAELGQGRIHPLFLMKRFLKLNLSELSSPHYRHKQVKGALTSALALISAEVCPVLQGAGKLAEDILADDTDLIAEWSNPYSLLRHFSSCHISVLPVEVVSGLLRLELQKLKSERELTSQRCQEGLDLAKYAIAFGLRDQASECLKFSAQNTLGYGWRKDITLHELFEAMDACSGAGIGDLPNWLERIAPFVDSIFEFSERENQHIPGWFLGLVAKHVPVRIVDEIQDKIFQQNWRGARDALKHWVAHADVVSASDLNFLRCMTSYSAIDALEERAKDDACLQEIFDEQVLYLGGEPRAPRERDESSFKHPDLSVLKFEDYTPKDMEKFEEKLSEMDGFSSACNRQMWMSHWEKKGKGQDLIDEFEHLWQKNFCSAYRFSNCLDEVFEISLRLHGKTKSRKWAVRSIQSNGHWSRWNHSDDILARYAEIYADVWEDFLVESTQSNKADHLSKGWIAVPRDALVKYLIAAKQHELACDITITMLESIEEEIKYLPLRPLYWSEKLYPSSELSGRAMLHYYQWPDRYSRMRTANQIARTLDEDEPFKGIFLEHLAEQKYESDVADLLSVLLLVEYCEFNEEELRAAINVPSLLSDHLLSRLGVSEPSQSTAGYYSDLDVDANYQSTRFEQGADGIATIYVNDVRRIRAELGYPLLQHMKAEWDEISATRGMLFFDPYSFCSDHFYPQDGISCSVSTRAESAHISAYLRSLAFAVDKLGFSYDEAIYYSTRVQPFGGVCSSLVPAQAPSNWPELNNVSADSGCPSSQDLSEWLKNLVNSDQEVLFANGPIPVNNKELICDLEVVKLRIAGHVSLGAKEIFELVERGAIDNGIYPYFEKKFVPNMGRWETSWYLRGFAIPSMRLASFGNGIEVRNDSVAFFSAHIEMASWQYWAHNWYPVWYRELGGNLGTCLIGNSNFETLIAEDDDGADVLIGKLTIVDRRQFNREDNVTQLYAMLPLT